MCHSCQKTTTLQSNEMKTNLNIKKRFVFLPKLWLVPGTEKAERMVLSHTDSEAEGCEGMAPGLFCLSSNRVTIKHENLSSDCRRDPYKPFTPTTHNESLLSEGLISV